MKTFLNIIITIVLFYVFLAAFAVRYKNTHREGEQVMCDIGVGDPIKGTVVAEDKKRIYIEGESQCLMYCLDNPYAPLDEEEIQQMNVKHKYKERYTNDDVKYKSACYRIGNDDDKMKAIINRYGRDEE